MGTLCHTTLLRRDTGASVRCSEVPMDFPSSNSQLEQVLISEGSSANFASTVRRAQMDVPRFPRGAVELQLSLHWLCSVPQKQLLVFHLEIS